MAAIAAAAVAEPGEEAAPVRAEVAQVLTTTDLALSEAIEFIMSTPDCMNSLILAMLAACHDHASARRFCLGPRDYNAIAEVHRIVGFPDRARHVVDWARAAPTTRGAAIVDWCRHARARFAHRAAPPTVPAFERTLTLTDREADRLKRRLRSTAGWTH